MIIANKTSKLLLKTFTFTFLMSNLFASQEPNINLKLMETVRKKDFSNTRKYLMDGKYDVNFVDLSGNSALAYSIKNQDIKITKLLLSRNASPTVVSSKGSPVYCDAMESKDPSMREIFKNYDVEKCLNITAKTKENPYSTLKDAKNSGKISPYIKIGGGVLGLGVGGLLLGGGGGGGGGGTSNPPPYVNPIKPNDFLSDADYLKDILDNKLIGVANNVQAGSNSVLSTAQNLTCATCSIYPITNNFFSTERYFESNSNLNSVKLKDVLGTDIVGDSALTIARNNLNIRNSSFDNFSVIAIGVGDIIPLAPKPIEPIKPVKPKPDEGQDIQDEYLKKLLDYNQDIAFYKIHKEDYDKAVSNRIKSTNASLSVENSKFTNIDSKFSGAAISDFNHAPLQGTINVKNSYFSSNSVDNEILYKPDDLDNLSSGGAIYAKKDLNVVESIFSNNKSVTGGGAIAIGGREIMELDANGKPKYYDIDRTSGARIYHDAGINFDTKLTIANLDIKNSLFENNFSSFKGGAIELMNNSNANIDNVTFKSNKTKSLKEFGGGAIYNNKSKLNIKNSLFIENVSGKGGAINNYYGELNIENSLFNSNNAENCKAGDNCGTGGAIRNFYASSVKLKNITFFNNNAIEGGAIYNYNSPLTIENSYFLNNQAEKNGGAIFTYFNDEYNNKKHQLNIIDTSFIGNTTKLAGSDKLGGAIYNTITTNIVADKRRVFFNDNMANGIKNAIFQDGNAVFVEQIINPESDKCNLPGLTNPEILQCLKDNPIIIDKVVATAEPILNLNAREGQRIVFNDSILSNKLTNQININNPLVNSLNGGEVVFNDRIDNNTISIYNGTLTLGFDGLMNNNIVNIYGGELNLINNRIGNTKFVELNLHSKLNLSLDVNLRTQKMDGLFADSIKINNGSIININKFNIVNEAGIEVASIDVQFNVSNSLKDKIVNNVSSANGKLFKYDVSYDANTQIFKFDNIGASTLKLNDFEFNNLMTDIATGNFSNLNVYGATANVGFLIKNSDIRTFNSELFKSAIAEQVGIKILKNINSSIFEEVESINLDINTIYSDKNTNTPNNKNKIWVKSFYSQNNFDTNNGIFNIDGDYYGAISGINFNIYNSSNKNKRENKVNISTSPYFGYLYSNYAYKENLEISNYDIKINQNSLLIGNVATLNIMNKFFSSINILGIYNFISSDSRSNNSEDKFKRLDFTASSKTGYNFRFKNNMFIIQPNISLSYLRANTEEWKNQDTSTIKSNNLNIVELEPSLKLILNLKHGFSSSLNASLILLNTTDSIIKFDNIELPSIFTKKQYQNYDLALRKSFGKNESIYLNLEARYSTLNNESIGRVGFGIRY